MANGILARAATSLIRWRQSQTAAGEGGVDILLRLVAETSKAPTVPGPGHSAAAFHGPLPGEWMLTLPLC